VLRFLYEWNRVVDFDSLERFGASDVQVAHCNSRSGYEQQREIMKVCIGSPRKMPFEKVSDLFFVKLSSLNIFVIGAIWGLITIANRPT
jgi:hypothetical protein